MGTRQGRWDTRKGKVYQIGDGVPDRGPQPPPHLAPVPFWLHLPSPCLTPLSSGPTPTLIWLLLQSSPTLYPTWPLLPSAPHPLPICPYPLAAPSSGHLLVCPPSGWDGGTPAPMFVSEHLTLHGFNLTSHAHLHMKIIFFTLHGKIPKIGMKQSHFH